MLTITNMQARYVNLYFKKSKIFAISPEFLKICIISTEIWNILPNYHATSVCRLSSLLLLRQTTKALICRLSRLSFVVRPSSHFTMQSLEKITEVKNYFNTFIAIWWLVRKRYQSIWNALLIKLNWLVTYHLTHSVNRLL